MEILATRESYPAALLRLTGGLLLALALALPAAAAGPAFTPAAECGLCHQELYRSWRNTFHAQAAANPVFLEEVDALDTGYGRGMRVLCLSCHAPTTASTMDFSLSRPLSREGVTCDFCHTVSAVDLDLPGMKLANDFSAGKRGPGRPDSRPAHRMSPSPLL